MNKGWPLVVVNLTPTSKVGLALSSVASLLLRKLLQLPTYLPSIKAASLDLFYSFAYLVLEVVPQT
jgi:hypothetical protein